MAKSSQKVRDYITAHPNAKAATIAKKFGITTAYVYVLRSNLRKKIQLDLPPEPEPKAETEYVFNYSEPVADMVNQPPHYTTGGIEVIDFIEAKELDYHLGNVIKYVSRAGKKNDALEDLKKARWYLDRAIARQGA